ncbi:hypothetical protein MRS76_06375 [Rhizobiaceae bacterium n13]|uniref:Uncharacterized protein n=1 Tax=Ferirhizobium litorale TaxID=2927786 RepID=A0AAE3QC22_9HYPH|nr:hypothetical protein [Fererhizobium litorale]MDI7861577.1 hypothetical protein [Fererhizobium litorale]MDI7922081.1 hypothetical protein [Fererhizobium litorale]
MNTVAIPSLPAPFTDCAALIGPANGREVLLASLLDGPDMIGSGVGEIARKWGPGDSRAAASLWSYGYFSRLLRPILAYGVLADHWFRASYNEVAVEFSAMSTVARFAMPDGCAPEEALDCALAHVQLVIDRCGTYTGTTARLHRSNAEYVFWRTHHMLASSEDVAHHDRLARIGAHMAGAYPDFGRLVARDITGAPTRRVCCLRDRLSSLKRCTNACPLRHQGCRDG